jgi:hypothetical protein
MTVNLSALAGAGQQFFTDSGVILSGGKLYTYAAGTTTPKTSYTSSSGNTAHTNPIILTSAGRVPGGEIWITAGSNYKFALYTSTDVLIATWDNITGINGTGIATNALFVEYDPPFTGAVATNVANVLSKTITVEDFGAVGDGVTNDTAAIQAAINYVATLDNKVLNFSSTAIYKITSIEILSVGAMKFIFNGCTFLGAATTPSIYMFKIHGGMGDAGRNTNFGLEFVGPVLINGNYNENYDVAIFCKSGYTKFIDVDFYFCVECFAFGDAAENPYIGVSEVQVDGGLNLKCPMFMEIVGANSLVFVTNRTINANYDVGPGQWASSHSSWALRANGGAIFVSNSQIQNNQATLTYPLTQLAALETEGVTPPTPSYGAVVNSYGYINFSNCFLESQTLLKTVNPDAISMGTQTPVVKMSNCGVSCGSGDTKFNFDATANVFVHLHSNEFHGGVAGVPFITCAAGSIVDIYAGDGQLDSDFPQGFDAYSGGILHYPWQRVMRAIGINQTFTAGSEIALKPANFNVGVSTVYKNYWNTSTGEFTVPQGGFTSGCDVSAQIKFEIGGVPSGGYVLQLYRNGAVVNIVTSTERYTPTISFFDDNCLAGTVYKVTCSATGSNGLTNGSAGFVNIQAGNITTGN